ncbi:hypothetical protein KFL_002500020 [Klebsormidium nitens]|uniref:HMG box domain-containing protein n=1 Tax=Klebsormidium nitens TaxID=105231 RepID=A0A1Y1I444_KLENI|nr:hypothetical protein KFL_002500020 [Klebsormidium nitens]|eukprot:GAQ85704.1 hypothetical protein KFL_002500020 [Klebsormidium nitens]
MSDVDTHMWRNVLLAGARGLEYTFGAIARALSGEQPVEASGFSLDHDVEPSQSGKSGANGRKKKEKKEKKEKRPPSAYNLFVSEQMKLRKAQNPEIPNTVHFKAVAHDWKTSTKNKKNMPGGSEAPAMTEDMHLEDFEEEAEGLLEGSGQGGDDEGEAEVTGRAEETADREAEERERAEKEKKDKKKRKKERQDENGPAHENGATGHHRDEEEGTADKRSSKKGKR